MFEKHIFFIAAGIVGLVIRRALTKAKADRAARDREDLERSLLNGRAEPFDQATAERGRPQTPGGSQPREETWVLGKSPSALFELGVVVLGLAGACLVGLFGATGAGALLGGVLLGLPGVALVIYAFVMRQFSVSRDGLRILRFFHPDRFIPFEKGPLLLLKIKKSKRRFGIEIPVYKVAIVDTDVGTYETFPLYQSIKVEEAKQLSSLFPAKRIKVDNDFQA